jgi:hypothetical protein
MRSIAPAIALVAALIAPAFAQKAEVEAVNAKWVRPRGRCRKKSQANISWCGKRSEATGSSQPISGTTASRSPIGNVRVCAPTR